MLKYRIYQGFRRFTLIPIRVMAGNFTQPMLRIMNLFALVGDAVDRTGLVIGHQNRPVPVLLHVNGAAQIVAVFIHPAFGEGFRLGGVALAVQKRNHDPRTPGLGRIPGPVLGTENRIGIFLYRYFVQ